MTEVVEGRLVVKSAGRSSSLFNPAATNCNSKQRAVANLIRNLELQCKIVVVVVNGDAEMERHGIGVQVQLTMLGMAGRRRRRLCPLAACHGFAQFGTQKDRMETKTHKTTCMYVAVLH